MAYIGIGYSGNDKHFLPDFVNKHRVWLKGDRQPKFFGSGFLILFDSNTAREFAKKCTDSSPPDTITVYPMGKPIDINHIRFS